MLLDLLHAVRRWPAVAMALATHGAALMLVLMAPDATPPPEPPDHGPRVIDLYPPISPGRGTHDGGVRPERHHVKLFEREPKQPDETSPSAEPVDPAPDATTVADARSTADSAGSISGDPDLGPRGSGGDDQGDGAGRASGSEGASERAPPSSTAIRLRSDVVGPVLIERVEPDYPRIAVANGIEGEVVLECVIDESGGVEVRRVLRSKPMLDAAAIEAVRQWRYQPALLDDRPQAVFLTVKVSFSLGR